MEFSHVRERLTLLLIILLPFHAFLVTVMTKVIAGAGQAPLPMLALWKEALLALLLLISIAEVLRNGKWQMANGNFLKIDLIDVCILLLGILAMAVSISHFPFPISHFALGAKYDFLPLLAFFVLHRVPWSEHFRLLVPRCLLLVGVIVAGFGIVTLFLPQSFFTLLGYSDLHSLYIPGGPIAAFQQIGGTGLRRMQSTMSGPNQLGLWMLLPWSVIMSFFINPLPSPPPSKGEGRKLLALFFIGGAIFLTFSRAAWIAAAVIAGTALWMHLPREKFRRIGFWLLVSGFCAAALLAFIAPQILFRAASTRDHFARPLEAIRTIAVHPLGLGLGSAGPASNRISDPCVHLEPGVDTSWAEAHPELCVFVGGIQRQPSDRACTCPRLPENWYLQIGVELGILGLVFSLLLVLLVLHGLWKWQMANGKWQMSFPITHSSRRRPEPKSDFPFVIFLTFLGLSLAALFLHAWEDSAVAYTVWILAAVTLACARGATERPAQARR